MRDVRGDLLENDEVEREAQTHVPHELEVVDHAVARDVRLPICSIGFLMSGSACCVMGCCFLAEILRLGAMSFLLLACVGRESGGECYLADMSATRSLLVEYECDTPGYSLSMSARDGATQHSYS